jgi:hypothetical protein
VADLDEALAALVTYGGDKVILPVKQG